MVRQAVRADPARAQQLNTKAAESQFRVTRSELKVGARGCWGGGGSPAAAASLRRRGTVGQQGCSLAPSRAVHSLLHRPAHPACAPPISFSSPAQGLPHSTRYSESFWADTIKM